MISTITFIVGLYLGIGSTLGFISSNSALEFIKIATLWPFIMFINLD